MDDLFLPAKSIKERLYEFIKFKKEVRTSEVIKWGCDNFTNRADRTARELAKQGLIKRLDDGEKHFRYGFKTKEDIWTII